jgi:dTDP-4-dehydrorhamnose 3,5-epimerase
MRYQPTPIPGAIIIEPDIFEDERGFFACIFGVDDFEQNGLIFKPAQANLAGNRQKGTLRGLHYQTAPFSEDKLVRAVRGAIFDVAVDLRGASPTFGQWFGAELSAENRRALLTPKGCAHGYLTLTEAAEVMYMTTQGYTPAAERGLRWDDPFCQVLWPAPPTLISPKDQSWPPFDPKNRAEP